MPIILRWFCAHRHSTWPLGQRRKYPWPRGGWLCTWFLVLPPESAVFLRREGALYVLISAEAYGYLPRDVSDFLIETRTQTRRKGVLFMLTDKQRIGKLYARVKSLEVTIENTISQLRGLKKMKGSELDMIQEYLIKSLEELWTIMTITMAIGKTWMIPRCGSFTSRHNDPTSGKSASAAAGWSIYRSSMTSAMPAQWFGNREVTIETRNNSYARFLWFLWGHK